MRGQIIRSHPVREEEGFAVSIAPVNGTELYYEVTGDSEPFALIAGPGQGIDYVAYAIPKLATVGKVVALELRGLGRGARPRTDMPAVLDLAARGVLDPAVVTQTLVWTTPTPGPSRRAV